MARRPIVSAANDSPDHYVPIASVAANVDLLALGPGAPADGQPGYCCWAIEVAVPGDVVIEQPDGTSRTIPSANWVPGMPKLLQARTILAATAATGLVVYWRT